MQVNLVIFIMKKYLNKLKFSDIYVVLFATGLFTMPLIVDKSHLPQGWELGKLVFVQYFSLGLITLSILHNLFLLFKKEYKWQKSNWWIVALIVLFVISTVFSPYSRQINNLEYHNSLHYLIYSFFKKFKLTSRFLKISMFGNNMREAGVITYSLIIIVMANLSKYLKNNTNFKIHIIFFSLILSSVYQAIIGIVQFIGYLQTDILTIKDGMWIFGTYGQSNFFAGHLLLGLVLSTMYLKSTFHSNLRAKLFLKYLSVLFTLLLIIAIIVSYSNWAIVMLIYILGVIFSYELLPKDMFYKIILIPSITILILVIPLSFIFINYLPEEYSFRTQVWQEIYIIYVRDVFTNFNITNLIFLLFGRGFDTMGEVFNQAGAFPTVYIDRAHNFLLQIFTTLGLAGMSIFVYSSKQILTNIKLNIKNPLFTYSFFALFIWIFRSMVHTSSIVNIFQAMALWVILNKTKYINQPI